MRSLFVVAAAAVLFALAQLRVPLAPPVQAGVPLALPVPGGAPLALPVPGGVPLALPVQAGVPLASPVQASSAVGEKNADDETDPLGANAACYVCHMTFVKEELSKVHLAAKVGCVKCHGLSAKHANDENIGATKPDITYKRNQVNAACAKCHGAHNVPARKVVGRFVERRLPAAPSPVCTDCHGAHKIEKGKPEERK